MKFAVFILRNAFRNRRRTILTILSISMSLFLICTLKSLLEALEQPPTSPEAARRVVVRRSTGLADFMPIAYREQIRQVPGVEEVTTNQWFGGIYKDPANFFAQFAVDADRFFDVYGEIRTQSPEQKQEFIRNRTASLVGVSLARRYGWKVGDRITLQGAIFPGNLETTITGLISGVGESNFYFHWDYFNEFFPQNISGAFVVKTKSPEDVPAVSDAIDAKFRNSVAPTKTETESAFLLGFMSMWGNVRTLVISISMVVLFTVILVAANTMAMSIRERTAEIAILKTLGFTPARILAMVIAEAALIALAGGLFGALAARFVYAGYDLSGYTSGFIQSLNVRWSTVLLSSIISLGVAFFSAFIPALGASRLPIAVGVRRRGE